MDLCSWNTNRRVVVEGGIVPVKVFELARVRFSTVFESVQIWWHLHGPGRSSTKEFRSY